MQESSNAESYSFARTKIQVPRLRAGLIERCELQQRVCQGLAQSRLTLLSAAGGFGKSSIMTQALASMRGDTAFAWVAAEQGDTLARLAACVVAALDPLDLPWRTSPEALIATLDSSLSARQRFADQLINALAATDTARGVIIIDDFHRVIDDDTLAFFSAFIEKLPPNWGVGLLTRVDPPWSLARLRASGELTEIRQDDLRFAELEIEALIRLNGKSVAANELIERTQGWPVGLTLALTSSNASGPGSWVRSERHVGEYLRGEVLATMPDTLRNFLVQTSVLPELTATRCAAVASRADADEMLDEIERRGLFFSLLDERERTLRLHDLFRDALTLEFNRQPAPVQSEIYRRAAAGESDSLKRIDYLLKSGDSVAAQRVFFLAVPDLLSAGLVDVVKRVLLLFPPAVRSESAELNLAQALLAWSRWDFTELLARALAARDGFAARGDCALRDMASAYAALGHNAAGTKPGATTIAIAELAPYDVEATDASFPETKLIMAIVRAFRAFDRLDFPAAQQHYLAAIHVAARQSRAALWFQVLPAVSGVGVHNLDEVFMQYASGALRAAGDNAPALRATALATQAALDVVRGNLTIAREKLSEADELFRWLNRPAPVAVYVQIAMTLCRTLQGERAAALTDLRAALSGVNDGSTPTPTRAVMFVALLGVRCAFSANDADAARWFVRFTGVGSDGAEQEGISGVTAAGHGYAALLDGSLAAAAAHFETALKLLGEFDICGIVTELECRLAWLYLRLDTAPDRADALQVAGAQHMRRALARVVRSGYVALPRLAGMAILTDLQQSRYFAILSTSEATAFAQVIGTGAERIAPTNARPVTLTGVSQAGAEAISPREMEVLELLAAGQSNKLIARSLDLSPHTVKRHVANILGKLGAVSRGEAAARYRELTAP